MARYAAFLSYSSRYGEWVATLHRNLERCLRHAGVDRPVFLDQVDLAGGRSWLRQLQAAIDEATHFVLVATPEAVASPRVADEVEGFITGRRDWSEGHFHPVKLVEAPLSPFLEKIQHLDFRRYDDGAYRRRLSRLAAALIGRGPRDLPELPAGIEVPPPPTSTLSSPRRSKLVGALVPLLGTKLERRAVATSLGLDHNALEDHPSRACAASAAVVLATGADDPLAAALRVTDQLVDLFDEDPRRTEKLRRLREELRAARPSDPEAGLLGAWLRKVVRDHEKLVPYFQQRTELALLDRVYVQLRLSADRRQRSAREDGVLHARGHWSLRELLALDSREKDWVTRRWVVLGDPGAGKTTLLRHLAASVARERPAPWVPVFESLPRLMREREWLLDRVAHQVRRAGEPAEGLPAVLDRAGQEGRLLLLLDGLDEVPRGDRDEAEGLLRQLAERWPRAPLAVTSRPIGYRRPDTGFQELELLPFDGESRREFLARWFGRETGTLDHERAGRAAAALEEDGGLRDLASNPLYLTLMALLIEQGASPERERAKLYDQVFALLLDGGYKYPKGEPMEAQQAVRGVLCHLAHAMTHENRDAEPVTALEGRLYKPEADALRAPLERVPRWRHGLRPFLDDLAERTGILGPHDGPDADWRYWHRTFREALASEALAARRERDGESAILEHAREVARDDLSRWAEPYALLAGRVGDADGLVKALVRENRDLGLRALATAQGLRDETLREVLELSEKWRQRAEVYQRLPELIDDPVRVLALVDQVRRRTRNGNDLFFLERAVAVAADKWPDARRGAEHLLERFYDHVPAPEEDLFRWVDTPRDGRVELWREIPAGRFLMGSSPEEGGLDCERPRHEVSVASPFRMAAVPVTVAQYRAFEPNHRPYSESEVFGAPLPAHPVETITWYQAYAFCRWLSAAVPRLRGVRMPTEEEWEYACRAGTQSRYWSGDEEADLDRVGWYDENSDNRTHRVGEKEASPWGLYDVHGNVWEWTLSGWTADYAGRESGVQVDPSRVDPSVFASRAADLSGGTGALRVDRGGGFRDETRYLRGALRYGVDPGVENEGLGFRLCLPGVPEPRIDPGS